MTDQQCPHPADCAERVLRWVTLNGESVGMNENIPTVWEFSVAMQYLAHRWMSYKDDGADVLASSVLDDIQEVCRVLQLIGSHYV